MAPYSNNARRSLRAAVETIIADRPTVVTRERQGIVDKFRGTKTLDTAGPFTVRLEVFRHTRIVVDYDEKGTTSSHSFVMIGVDIPTGTFKLDDIVAAADGQRYRVASVLTDDIITEVNVEKVQ